MIRAGNEELRHRRLFGSTNDRPRKITTRSRDFLIAIPYLHVKKASHKISCQSDLNRASYEQLCRLSKINICSCHFAFCAICIYRGYHGDCTPSVPDTGAQRPRRARLARPRQGHGKANTGQGCPTTTRTRPRPTHAASPARTTTRSRPSPACFLAQRPVSPAHPVRDSPSRDQLLPDAVPDLENYDASPKSVSVPVTLLFVQYVYIGGTMGTALHRCPIRGCGDQAP